MSTYNRCALCERAVRSALAQDTPPLEVLVVDNGSSDDTPAAIRALSQDDPRVRYLSLPQNSGSAARPRNAGVREARGEWVALLDDDDEWLPEKLSAQAPYLEAGHVLVCGNALRSDGTTYFPEAERVFDFGRRELLRDNPVVASTAIVRRLALLDAGGFPEGDAYAGVEDYAAWLALADRDGRFTRIPRAVVRYGAGSPSHISADALRNQRLVAGIAWSRWRRRPADPRLALAAGRHLLRVAKVWSRSALGRRDSRARSSTAS